MNNEKHSSRRALIARCSLFIVHCSLLISAAGCGGGNNGVEVADLKGDRKGFELTSIAPADDLGPAPTPAHGRLAALLPREALVRGSVAFSDWDQTSATPTGDGKNAALPTVQAMYESAGYNVVVDDKKAPQGKTRKQIERPQEATLILVQAPEAGAAEAVAESLRKHFAGKGFSVENPMLLGDGKTMGGVKIERFLRIDSGAEADSVYVAYLNVIGNVVVYAVETEQPPPIKAADGTQAKRVLDGPIGARLGGQLVVQVRTRAGQ